MNKKIHRIWYPDKDRIRKWFNKISFNWNRPNIKMSFKVKEKYAHSKGTILDLETTGTPNNKKAQIITAGFFNNNKVDIFQSINPFKINQFQMLVKSEVLYRPLPLRAYSAGFEQYFTKYGKSKLNKEKIWDNLLEYWRYGRSKLIYCIASPCDDIEGISCPRLWFEWVNYLNTNSLFEIIYHNILDVLRESYVYQKQIEKFERYKVVIGDIEYPTIFSIWDQGRYLPIEEYKLRAFKKGDKNARQLTLHYYDYY